MKFNFVKRLIVVFYISLWGIYPVFPQVPHRTGFKYFKNFSPQDYNNQPQNWGVLQDKAGIICVANQGGLMVFDGVSWRKISIPNHVVRSMVIDDTSPSKIIYIGGINEIGYATPDKTGQLRYVSLRDKIPSDIPNFSEVFATHHVNKQIYFQTSTCLFCWDLTTLQMKVLPIDGNAKGINTFSCNNKLYIYQSNSGLAVIETDRIRPLAGETKFDSKICMLCPFHSGRILIGTASNGLFLYDGVSSVPFPTEVDGILKRNRLYTGLGLSSMPGQFALGVAGAGLLIIDSQGKLVYSFERSLGLPVDSISNIFEDAGGNLWLSLEKGLSKVEYTSPFFNYDIRMNLRGMGLALIKYEGIFFAGTTEGLFYLTATGKFRPVQGTGKNYECWSLLSTGDSLLAGFSDGTYRVDLQGNGDSIHATKVMNRFTYVLYQSRKEPNRVLAGSTGELISLYRENKTVPWKQENIIPLNGQVIKSITEDNAGYLWLGTVLDGVIRFNFTTDSQPLNFVHFTTFHGLPPGGVQVTSLGDQVLFLTQTGLARYDEIENRFFSNTIMGEIFAMSGTRPIFRLIEDSNRNTWFHCMSRNYHGVLKPDGEYTVISRPFLRVPLAQVNCIYFDEGDRNAWFASMDGLIRYEPDMKSNSDPVFNAVIRKVQLINGKIPVFYGEKEAPLPGQMYREFQYKDRNIRFEFAAPFFVDESQTTYSYRLEGYDDDWAPFSSETKKDYTNLDAGTYTFRVQAKNVYGDFSREGLFYFKILPPWYQSWWVYLIYGAIIFLVMHLVVRWRSRHLVLEKHKLAQIIGESTEEINNQKQQLLKQAEKLKEMDKVKSQFFANISHEFRTPLTLILGPLEQMLASLTEKDSEQRQKMRLMLRNSRRLLGLINQLLELSRFDSGTMKLQAAQHNIIPFLKGILHTFDSLAFRKVVELRFQSKSEEITLYYDPEKLEEVISNLVFNAIKFTPSGGVITLSVGVIKSESNKNEPGSRGEENLLEISVTDTGPGIARDELAHIFDRFYQAEGIFEHRQQGTGIGLAIAREIVELHNGTITAISPVSDGSGTRLVIRLPMEGSNFNLNEAPSPEKSPLTQWAQSQGLLEEDMEVLYESLENEKEGHQESDDQEKDIILIVDDSPDVREYIREALEPHYTVKEAKDGKEGMQLAMDIVPDLVICDIMMPGPDGYEVCRNIKNDVATSHIPVIMLTAKAGEECILTGLESGADDYITKPFSTKILCARIKNLIDLRHHLHDTLKREMAMQPSQIKVSNLDEEFLKDLYRVLEKNIANPDFNVEELSRKLYMNRVTVYRKINALTGENPTEFIRSYRLKRGAELLSAGGKTVLEVAFEVGFSSSSYFIKCFKEKFHRLPTEYQRVEKMKDETA